MNSYEKLGRILGVEAGFLKQLDAVMASRTGKKDVMGRVIEENDALVAETFEKLDIPQGIGAESARTALLAAAKTSETELLSYLKIVPGATEFEKVAGFAKQIANVGRGFFLKKEFGAEILRKSHPVNLLSFLGVEDIDELLAKHDVTEIFSALRFVESDVWMHETFERAYSDFTAKDFEERDISIKVLGPEWQPVAEKFVAKKHHNVSHLKEFGVIFLNPIKEDTAGKFLRDFALLLHYFHEIEFYSKLFRRYSAQADFASRLKALLRGDVKNVSTISEGEWLIVQRYLFKENPQDPRLFLPRMNPESLHWMRGERDLAELGKREKTLELEMWYNRDWVAYYDEATSQILSLDMEDNVMSAVSAAEGKKDSFIYHQREALWSKLFLEYAGGEAETERLLLENFDKGIINF